VIYRDLAKQLAPDVGVVVFQSRGLDGQAPPRTSVEEMAAAYVTDLMRLQPAGPYAIGGASFGGLVAWEMARRLRDRGGAIGLLVLLDSAFPPLGVSAAVRTLSHFPGFARTLYPPLRRCLSHARAVRRLGWRRYGEWLLRDRQHAQRVEQARLAQQVGAAGLSVLDELSRVRDANERALANYVPPRYDGDVCFCRARDGRDEDDTRDWWRDLARHIVYHDLPGNHGTMLLEPNVGATAAVLRLALLTLDTSVESGATSLPPPPHQRHRVPV
jgi:thioesterase domain-containing protein